MDLTDCSTVNTPSGRVVTCTSSKKAITSDGCIETLNCFQGSVLTQSEQGLQYKITLFAFALSNLMNNPSFPQKMCGRVPAELQKTKGRNVSPFGIWPTAPITAQLKENTVSPGSLSLATCDALTPRPGCQNTLEWLRCCPKTGHELFGHRLGDV